MKKISLKPVILSTILLASSCGAPPPPPVTAEKVSKIKKGVTTCAEIKKMFGNPSVSAYVNITNETIISYVTKERYGENEMNEIPLLKSVGDVFYKMNPERVMLADPLGKNVKTQHNLTIHCKGVGTDSVVSKYYYAVTAPSGR